MLALPFAKAFVLGHSSATLDAMVIGRLPAISSFLCCLLLACSTVRDDLRRAEVAFGQARYEDVEAWTSELASELAEMPAEQRARYYYLAGMSAFRIGKRARARHALVLCREEVETGKVALPETWSRNLGAALSELAN